MYFVFLLNFMLREHHLVWSLCLACRRVCMRYVGEQEESPTHRSTQWATIRIFWIRINIIIFLFLSQKLIKDAFTSRKRLSKEYEHLAILYGDIDIESSQHFRPSSVPSSPNSFILDMGLHSSQEMCDADWELL